MSVIYNKIKQLRKGHHISQQELASYLKIERTSLSKIENMHYNPSIRIISKIANFFDLPIGDIFFNHVVSFNDTKEIVSQNRENTTDKDGYANAKHNI
ncbi:helix-turn-helix transcriptional regulator [Virgibacillus salexigens]|uniref:helix-turn-helix transcriptional regulator n=1 Tax=Virgibacillus salexigens TaxID=61016 RepID=UPI00190E01D1|nr:helix-turn-helix transcriptional regulator [Virgibacillus salexigens]